MVYKNGEMIATKINQSRASAVTDGLFKDGIGTTAFMIEGEDAKTCILGVNIAPGHSEDQYSL